MAPNSYNYQLAIQKMMEEEDRRMLQMIESSISPKPDIEKKKRAGAHRPKKTRNQKGKSR